MENSSDHETQNGIESVTSGPPLLGMIEGRQSRCACDSENDICQLCSGCPALEGEKQWELNVNWFNLAAPQSHM